MVSGTIGSAIQTVSHVRYSIMAFYADPFAREASAPHLQCVLDYSRCPLLKAIHGQADASPRPLTLQASLFPAEDLLQGR